MMWSVLLNVWPSYLLTFRGHVSRPTVLRTCFRLVFLSMVVPSKTSSHSSYQNASRSRTLPHFLFCVYCNGVLTWYAVWVWANRIPTRIDPHNGSFGEISDDVYTVFNGYLVVSVICVWTATSSESV